MPFSMCAVAHFPFVPARRCVRFQCFQAITWRIKATSLEGELIGRRELDGQTAWGASGIRVF